MNFQCIDELSYFHVDDLWFHIFFCCLFFVLFYFLTISSLRFLSSFHRYFGSLQLLSVLMIIELISLESELSYPP